MAFMVKKGLNPYNEATPDSGARYEGNNMKKRVIACLAVIMSFLLSGCDEKISSSFDSSDSSDSSLVSSLASSEAEAKPSSISFYALNDTHGAIEADTGNSYPGMARVATAIASDSFYTSSSVLLSSGDMFQGSALSNISEGLCMTDIMNQLGFVSLSIGNHEFDWGIDKIENEEKEADFPFLGINIYSKSTGERALFAKPSAIINRGGAKIGIIGSIHQGIASAISASKITDIDFKDDGPLVVAEAKRLKEEEDCDLVILSTHQGYNGLPAEIKSCSDLDGVFLGHDHFRTNEYYSGKYFIEGGSSGKYYSRMSFDLQSNGDYKLSEAYHANGYAEVSMSEEEDQDVKAIISEYDEKIGPVKNSVIGTRSGDFYRYNSAGQGSLGQFVTDAMEYYAKDLCQQDDIVTAFHNIRGVRADLSGGTENADGTVNITIGDLYTILPFDNLVQAISISGASLIGAAGSDYYSSDLTYENGEWYLKGAEVSYANTYKVVTLDYLITKTGDPLYKGSEGGENLKGEQAYIRDVVTSYIQHLCENGSSVKASDFNRVY